MINDKITEIFDDVFLENIDKKNYLIHYKFIYDKTINSNEYEIELIKNSLLINYQNLCIRYSELFKEINKDIFLDNYYNIYNELKKKNNMITKIFVYYLKQNKNINIDRIFTKYWGELIININLKIN